MTTKSIQMRANMMLEKINESGIIAILVIDDSEKAVPLAEALLEGGIRAMELTLRTNAALSSLRSIVREVPDMLAGVGTVLDPKAVLDIVEAGADFAVSPGLNPSVVKAATDNGLPFIPGIATPSDIERGLELGCNVLKFFPAEPLGGSSYLKTMSSPYKHLNIKYIPLGGINATNLRGYLSMANVLAVGGSWIAPRDKIRKNDWSGIRALAREATSVFYDVRHIEVQ